MEEELVDSVNTCRCVCVCGEDTTAETHQTRGAPPITLKLHGVMMPGNGTVVPAHCVCASRAAVHPSRAPPQSRTSHTVSSAT